MKQTFIKKWSSWWCLQKQGKELTAAFENELNELLKDPAPAEPMSFEEWWTKEPRLSLNKSIKEIIKQAFESGQNSRPGAEDNAVREEEMLDIVYKIDMEWRDAKTMDTHIPRFKYLAKALLSKYTITPKNK